MKRELDQNCSCGGSTHCGQQTDCANENYSGVERTPDGPAGNCFDYTAAERGGCGQ